MNAIGMAKFTFINSLLNLVVNGIAVFIGLKYFGVKGAVAGGVLAIYIGYIFPVLAVNKKLRCSLRDYFPFKTFFSTLLLSILTACVFFMVSRVCSFNNLQVIFMAPIYYCLVFFLVNKYIIEVVNLKRLPQIIKYKTFPETSR
jgi:O-antigen/teichoic acid export membrane protein